MSYSATSSHTFPLKRHLLAVSSTSRNFHRCVDDTLWRTVYFTLPCPLKDASLLTTSIARLSALLSKSNNLKYCVKNLHFRIPHGPIESPTRDGLFSLLRSFPNLQQLSLHRQSDPPALTDHERYAAYLYCEIFRKEFPNPKLLAARRTREAKETESRRRRDESLRLGPMNEGVVQPLSGCRSRLPSISYHRLRRSI